MADLQNENEEGQENESAVIRQLRQQIKDLNAQVKEGPSADVIEEEVAKRVQRRDTTRDVLVQLGYPAQMTELVSKSVEEPTEESVAEFLKGLGLDAKPQAANDEKAKNVGKVAGLASQVAAATGGQGGKLSVEEELAQAKSQSEINAIMVREGLAQ